MNGFIALTSIVILGAVILLVSIGLVLRAIDDAHMTLDEDLSNRARMLVDACAEYALLQLKRNVSYAGNETIVLGGSDSCAIFPIGGSGNEQRTIQTESVVSGYVRRVKIEVARLRPVVQINAWEDVADF